MKTIVEIHVLQNFAPSNLNRDDTGSPKDAIFGGSRRARISSQCTKRAVRSFFQSRVESGIFSASDLAVRTKRLSDHLVSQLVGNGLDASEAAQKVPIALGSVKLTVKEDGKNQYLLYLGRREIEGIVAAIEEHWESIPSESAVDSEEKGKKQKSKKDSAQQGSPELRQALTALLNGGKAIDLGLFGRMLADLPEKNQNAACQVAHSISTHAVDREFDFFTAIDDLKPEDTAGSDMMGTVEFNSACFYRYANIDVESLTSNLGGDRELALKGIHTFLEAFVVAEPSGKQNTFAAHNPPEYVYATVRFDAAPRSLANAFEVAVRPRGGESLTAESANRMLAKADALERMYGRDRRDQSFLLAADELNGAVGVPKVNSLSELLESAVSAIGG